MSLLLFACAGPASEVQVFAAASLTDALTEIGAHYERAGGARVVFNFAASSVLARQIENGAPADLFLSADEAQMNGVAEQIAARANILSNELVVVVAGEGGAKIATPRDLIDVRTLALADPSAVPAGVYARTYLERIGLWDRIAARVIRAENVRAALAAVAAGNADAAIVYRTDAAIEPRVRVACTIADGPPISYPFALMKDADEPSRRFFDYLQSRDARAVFARHGFIVR